VATRKKASAGKRAAQRKKTAPRKKTARAMPRAGTPAARAGEHDYLVRRRVEDLAQAYLSLASELWITKDRIAVLEHVLERHGIPAATAVDAVQPEGELKARLDRMRKQWAERIAGALFPRGLPKGK
jgi:hypothetical protein